MTPIYVHMSQIVIFRHESCVCVFFLFFSCFLSELSYIAFSREIDFYAEGAFLRWSPAVSKSVGSHFICFSWDCFCFLLLFSVLFRFWAKSVGVLVARPPESVIDGSLHGKERHHLE